ncbi:sensor histidine kinase [Phosphitispora fastidiosa]|uniref:sensor histidine kinase n=1 Tax=Phosphitispora fastidiosa TaxID=2837202 RepID=UPI001E53F249|nr:histidine kinase [Phosphitispora fastidiosa]MBU7006553.1 signal transduction histidine kinase [Phosphitispora fastidiosa]
MKKKACSAYAALLRDKLRIKGSDLYYILLVYRYGSWFITSAFYLMGPPESPYIFKIGVVLALLASITPMVKLFENAGNSRLSMIPVVVVETVGIAFLLIPTGGLQSPFIWYALNPVLAAASFLPFYACWLNTIFYLGVSFFIYSYKEGFNSEIVRNSVLVHTNTIMVFMLITLTFQLYSRFISCLKLQANKLNDQKHELLETNRKLAKAYHINEEYMKHVNALYQSVEAFCSHDDREELVEIFVRYGSILTGGIPTCLCLWEGKDGNDKQNSTKFSSGSEKAVQNEIIEKLYDLRSRLQLDPEPAARIKIETAGKELICVSLKSAAKDYGVLAALVDSVPNGVENISLKQRLIYLAKLSTVIFERMRLEEIADKLILNEEQNRIADEIHDTVSQRLFSISFALHSLAGECERMTPADLKEQLKFMQKSAGKASKELRESIYRLSSRKNGKVVFFKSISTYLTELARLNSIKVYFEATGQEELLNSEIRMVFYRVIREATGNAIKHAKCSSIKVDLNIMQSLTQLTVFDDGVGFDFAAGSTLDKGLGLKNMERLIRGINGYFQVGPGLTGGTEVICRIPLGGEGVFDVRGGYC